jgi:hypothetical protein
MKPAELLREVIGGRLLIVGEFRGAHAETRREVDRKSGEAFSFVQGMLLAECKVRGNLDRAIFYQRFPDVEDAAEVVFPYMKGKLYVFFLVSLKNERGQVTGSLGDRKPELLELDEEEGGGPVGAPLGAPMGLRP